MPGPKLPRVPPRERSVKRPPASSAFGALSRYLPAPANASTGKKCECRSMFIRSLTALEIGLEELERSPPRLLRRFGMIALGRSVGVKTVLRAGIDLVRVRLAVLLHRGDGAGDVLVDAGIFLAVMRQHR